MEAKHFFPEKKLPYDFEESWDTHLEYYKGLTQRNNDIV